MRFVVWNCNMALHRKMMALASLAADIAVVPECADPQQGEPHDPSRTRVVWVGENPKKGLGVFASDGFELSLHSSYSSSHRIFAPIEVRGRHRFNLLAVWSFNDRKLQKIKGQPGAILRALEAYDEFCREAPLIVAGDFNNNVGWDRPRGTNNHSAAVESLALHGLVSAYHATRNVVFGEELEPTHYWRERKKDRPCYHIDYIFLPKRWMPSLREISLGSFEEWCGNGLSDHVPLIADFEAEQEAK